MTSPGKHPLIGKRFPVHAHGFVELLDFMGSDQDIAEAAWVSTEFGSLKKSPVPQFIDYLLRKGHWSPFEMCEVKLRVMVPLAIEGQWVTHRTASKNQASARYVVLPENNFKPQVWRAGSTGHHKQGSASVGIEQSERADEIYEKLVQHARQAEHELRALGVAPELARFAELTSQYTMKVWKIDLRNLMNFLRQRTDAHAQQEIQDYANIIEHIAEQLFPHAMAAWKNHVKYAVTFSREEQEFLAGLLDLALGNEFERHGLPNSISDALDRYVVLKNPHARKSQLAELAAKIRHVLEVA